MFQLRAPRLLIAASAAAAGVLLGAPLAIACGTDGYSYAGVGAPRHAFGIAATVTPLSGIDVRSGHVAGWVGVGGPGQGPDGGDEWLQVGFSRFPESRGNDLYYELARPGTPATYHRLAADLPMGASARIAVLEMHARPNMWRIWVNGSAVSKPIFLPASHGRWSPVATAESWDGGSAGRCNGFRFHFRRVAIARIPGGGWQRLAGGHPIRNRATRVVRAARRGSFVAVGLQQQRN